MNDEDIIFSIADRLTKHSFNSIWDMEGDTMINLKKKEVAEEMFFKGIAYILHHLNNMNQIKVNKIQKKFKT